MTYNPGTVVTKTDDTNVTLTLGGTPTKGAVNAFSLALGWTGSLAPGRGGTGIVSYAVGDLIYASGATTLSKLADVATGNALISGGVTTAPLWGKIGLTTHVTGTLPIANGGTNQTALGDITRVNDTNVTLTLGGTPTGAVVTSTSFTLGWTGTLSAARGGTGVGSLGNITKSDDTNVTLTLGGTPTGAVITSTSFTLGWTGTLAVARGGTNATTASGARTNLGLGTMATQDASAVSISGGSAVLATLEISGASGAIVLDDRDGSGQFVVYHDTGTVRFFDGADRFVIGGVVVVANVPLRLPSYTVATLPAAATAGAGATAFVTDALAPAFGAAVAGGGAVGIPVYSTGAAWNVG